MTDTPTYDDLSALCAQMAAALEQAEKLIHPFILEQNPKWKEQIESALTAYRTLSPDPQWQRVPEGAAADVLAERRRQIEKEGWTPEHDDQHGDGSMAQAAAVYAEYAASGSLHHTGTLIAARGNAPVRWPWNSEWWKPKTRRHDLVRAGALIIAEIERLDRARGEG